MKRSQQNNMNVLTNRLRQAELTKREFLIGSSAMMAASGLSTVPGMARAQSSPKKGGLMRLGLPYASQNDSLDPGTWATLYTGASFNGGVYNNLVEVLPDGSVAGDLAESWEASNEAKTWRFKLRSNITFHDGRSLVAEDVRQSLEHHKKPDSTSGARAVVDEIVSIETEGDDTVKITLLESNADLPYLLSAYQLSIFPALEGGGIDWQSGKGTGAFTLESFEPGVATRLVRNPNYHKPLPYLDEVEFISIADDTARLNALLTGEVDFIGEVDTISVPMVERSNDLHVQRIPGLRHLTFDIDTRVAPFDNSDVRLALKYALDRDDYIAKIFLGEARKGNDNPVSDIQKFYHQMPQREYSIAKAKEHLAKAGLDSVTVDLHVAENAFPGAVDAAILYAEHAAPAGITINVVREADDSYWQNVWLKEPFVGVDWFGRATVDWLFSTIYTSSAPWNAGWSNARFDELHAMARAETDEAKRAAYYAEMQQIIHDDGNTVVFAFLDWRNAMSNNIGYGDVGGLMPMDNMRICERWWRND